MMKKWMLLILATVLMLACCVGATAESELIHIGDGDLEFGLFVVPNANKVENAYAFVIHTEYGNLMDALTAVEMISVSKTSWGYMVDSVLGVTNDFKGNGLYWNMYQYDSAEDEFFSLSSGIQNTKLHYGDQFLFLLQ